MYSEEKPTHLIIFSCPLSVCLVLKLRCMLFSFSESNCSFHSFFTAVFLNNIILYQSLLFYHLLLNYIQSIGYMSILMPIMMGKKIFHLICTYIQVGERILCRHPFNESKRAYVVPQQVEELLKCYWPGISGASLVIFDNHLRENSVDYCPMCL